MRKSFILCMSLALLASAGCNHRRVNIAGIPSTPYHKAQNKLIQHKKIYALEKVIFDTYASYQSRDLRIKYVDEYAEIFGLTAQEKEELLTKELAEDEEFDVFYIAHFASENGYQKLHEKSPDKKIWAIRLQDQDSSLRPISIDPLKATSHQTHFYPYMDGFSKLYKIKFRKSTDPTKVLTMSSPARNLKFQWKAE